MPPTPEPAPGSCIPAARQKLRAIADELTAVNPALALRIAYVIDHLMVRRVSEYSRAAARDRLRRLTPELAAEIRKVKREHPDLAQDEIAILLGCGAGRVSEALAGYDYPPVYVRERSRNG